MTGAGGSRFVLPLLVFSAFHLVAALLLSDGGWFSKGKSSACAWRAKVTLVALPALAIWSAGGLVFFDLADLFDTPFFPFAVHFKIFFFFLLVFVAVLALAKKAISLCDKADGKGAAGGGGDGRLPLVVFYSVCLLLFFACLPVWDRLSMPFLLKVHSWMDSLAVPVLAALAFGWALLRFSDDLYCNARTKFVKNVYSAAVLYSLENKTIARFARRAVECSAFLVAWMSKFPVKRFFPVAKRNFFRRYQTFLSRLQEHLAVSAFREIMMLGTPANTEGKRMSAAKRAWKEKKAGKKHLPLLFASCDALNEYCLCCRRFFGRGDEAEVRKVLSARAVAHLNLVSYFAARNEDKKRLARAFKEIGKTVEEGFPEVWEKRGDETLFLQEIEGWPERFAMLSLKVAALRVLGSVDGDAFRDRFFRLEPKIDHFLEFHFCELRDNASGERLGKLAGMFGLGTREKPFLKDLDKPEDYEIAAKIRRRFPPPEEEHGLAETVLLTESQFPALFLALWASFLDNAAVKADVHPARVVDVLSLLNAKPRIGAFARLFHFLLHKNLKACGFDDDALKTMEISHGYMARCLIDE